MPAAALRIDALAWEKFMHFAYKKKHEVGCFAICAADDLLRIIDFHFPKQECSGGYVDIDENSHMDFIDKMMFTKNEAGEVVPTGMTMDRILRIWTHTHPGTSPQPSGVDEDFFKKNYGNADWAIMLIYACDGIRSPTKSNTFARLKLTDPKTGVTLTDNLPVEVLHLQNTDLVAKWDAEFEENVKEKTWNNGSYYRGGPSRHPQSAPHYADVVDGASMGSGQRLLQDTHGTLGPLYQSGNGKQRAKRKNAKKNEQPSKGQMQADVLESISNGLTIEEALETVGYLYDFKNCREFMQAIDFTEIDIQSLSYNTHLLEPTVGS